MHPQISTFGGRQRPLFQYSGGYDEGLQRNPYPQPAPPFTPPGAQGPQPQHDPYSGGTSVPMSSPRSPAEYFGYRRAEQQADATARLNGPHGDAFSESIRKNQAKDAARQAYNAQAASIRSYGAGPSASPLIRPQAQPSPLTPQAGGNPGFNGAPHVQPAPMMSMERGLGTPGMMWDQQGMHFQPGFGPGGRDPNYAKNALAPGLDQMQQRPPGGYMDGENAQPGVAVSSMAPQMQPGGFARIVTGDINGGSMHDHAMSEMQRMHLAQGQVARGLGGGTSPNLYVATPFQAPEPVQVHKRTFAPHPAPAPLSPEQNQAMAGARSRYDGQLAQINDNGYLQGKQNQQAMVDAQIHAIAQGNPVEQAKASQYQAQGQAATQNAATNATRATQQGQYQNRMADAAGKTADAKMTEAQRPRQATPGTKQTKSADQMEYENAQKLWTEASHNKDAAGMEKWQWHMDRAMERINKGNAAGGGQPAANTANTGQAAGGQQYADGTVIQMPDGSTRVRRGKEWVAQ